MKTNAEMNSKFTALFVVLLAVLSCGSAFAQSSKAKPKLKPRVIVLTDISTWETDDHESLIRLLAHADLFEIEGIVVSTGYSISTLTKSPEKEFINIAHGVVDAYEKDLPNLMKRSNQSGHAFDDGVQQIGYWPSASYLRERTMFGSLNRGKKFIGDDNDSPGSELLIKLADEDDDRPLWVNIWGGGNTLAQAIYKVKKERSAEEFKTFLSKLRPYAITDQDRSYKDEGHEISSHGWIYEQAGNDLKFIWDEVAWKGHNGLGKSNWNLYAQHIQNHGNMGSQYPKYKYGVEGDTPAFLHIMPNGLNDPEDPSQSSWGGNFVNKGDNLWREAKSCGENFKQTYPAAFNNFAARMDWAKDGTGNRNPQLVLDGDSGYHVLTRTADPGASVTLDASQSTDPDGDKLTFKWWVQGDAGSYEGDVKISDPSASKVTVEVPADSKGKSFHVVCEVTDNGTHNLSSYRRVIFQSTDSVASGENVEVPSETDESLSFRQWLFEFFPAQYPDARMTDHTYWMQAHVGDGVVASWTEWTENDSSFKAMEAHNLVAGKPMFLEQKGPKNKEIADHPAVTFYEGAGYYISGYDPATMGQWDGKGLSVIQFDGEPAQLARVIGLGWARQTSFASWLYQYLPVRYPEARMTDYGKWKQAHITDGDVASWEKWTVKDVTLKYIEDHSLIQGKSFFIQKAEKTQWADHDAVKYYPGVGYYCTGYDSATMSDWGVEGLTLIQFDGDSKEVVEAIVKGWLSSSSTTQDVIIDSEAVSRIDSALNSFVESGDIAGISALVVEDDKEVYFKTFGMADKEAGRPMARDTIVQIFSMTKPITGVALMQLHEQGKFKLDDPVSKYIPSFANLKVATGKDGANNLILEDLKRAMTIRDLTRHTSGLASSHGSEIAKEISRTNPLKRENSLAQAVEEFSKLPLCFQPGEQWLYGPSVDIQARLVEVISGQKFDEYLHEHIFQPLKMNQTRYFVPESDRDRLAGVYWRDDETGELSRKSDEREPHTKHWPLTPGGWGLTSTIDDYMRFARMLQNDGEFDGVRILKPETVKLMSTNQLSDDVKERSWLPGKGQVGFGIDFAVRMGPSTSKNHPVGATGEFFWDGAASTLFWVDPENDLTAVMFVQLRPYDKIGLHNRFRKAVYGPEKGN